MACAARSAFALARLQHCHYHRKWYGDLLFRAYDLPFDILVVVRSSTCGAQAIHVVLDIVIAELADLTMSPVSTERPI